MGGKKQRQKKRKSSNTSEPDNNKSLRFSNSPGGSNSFDSNTIQQPCSTPYNNRSSLFSDSTVRMANSNYTGQNMQGSLPSPPPPPPPSMGGTAAHGYGYYQPMTALLNSPPATTYNVPNSTASSGPYPYPQQVYQQSNAGNSEVMRYLANIDMKLTEVNRRLQTLDIVEKKIDDFDKELKKMYTTCEDRNKKMNEKVTRLDERSDTLDFLVEETQNRVEELEKENMKLKDTIMNMKSDTLKDTLIVGGITEDENETEQALREKLQRLMKYSLEMDSTTVEQMQFIEIRRLGNNRRPNSQRKILVKFASVQDREKVKKLKDKLKDSDEFIHELFPKEVVDERKRLIPHMLRARQDGKEAWISYNKLYVNREIVTCYPPHSASGISGIDEQARAGNRT